MTREATIIDFKEGRFHVFPEVYKPSDDTYLLLDNMEVELNAEVLEVGCGCGILSIVAAERARSVTALDVNPQAVLCAKFNAEQNGVSDKVEVYCGDMLTAVRGDRKFDVVLFNAPYLPTDAGESGGFLEKAWAGGEAGRGMIDRFLDSIGNHIKLGGSFQMVQSSLSDIDKTIAIATEMGFEAKVVAEKRFMFERLCIIRARLTRLRS